MGRISPNAHYTRIRKSARARANTSRTYLARLNQWRIGAEIGQCTKIHVYARSSRIMFPGHRNRINCIDRQRVHRCTNAADCDATGRGWEFAADKFGDGKFPIFVSRSRLTGPYSELMATVSSATAAAVAAAAEMNPAARSRWLARNIQNRL